MALTVMAAQPIGRAEKRDEQSATTNDCRGSRSTTQPDAARTSSEGDGQLADSAVKRP